MNRRSPAAAVTWRPPVPRKASTPVNRTRLFLVAVSTVAVGIGVAAPAGGTPLRGSTVTALRGDLPRYGGGRRDHNASTFHSPTYNRGPQLVTNANAGGSTANVNALCKRRHACQVNQRFRMYSPDISGFVAMWPTAFHLRGGLRGRVHGGRR